MPSPAYHHQFRVALPDTDVAGVLFFAHLFRHAHDAYEAWMSSLGFPLHEMIRTGAMALPLVHAEADYRRPLKHGELVTVELFLADLQPARFTIDYRFLTDRRMAALARTIHVCIDPSMPAGPDQGRCAVRLPESFSDTLRANLATPTTT